MQKYAINLNCMENIFQLRFMSSLTFEILESSFNKLTFIIENRYLQLFRNGPVLLKTCIPVKFQLGIELNFQ